MVGAGLFLVTWVVMMVAMIFPAAAPMVLTHAGVVRSRGEGTVRTVAFLVGYPATLTTADEVWVGLLPLFASSFSASARGVILYG